MLSHDLRCCCGIGQAIHCPLPHLVPVRDVHSTAPQGSDKDKIGSGRWVLSRNVIWISPVTFLPLNIMMQIYWVLPMLSCCKVSSRPLISAIAEQTGRMTRQSCSLGYADLVCHVPDERLMITLMRRLMITICMHISWHQCRVSMISIL